MTTKRRMSYEEFVAGLPEVLDDLARADETVLIEKDGHTFSVVLTALVLDERLPPLPPLEVRLEALRKAQAAFTRPIGRSS